MRNTRLFPALLLIALVLPAGRARADAIIVTQAMKASTIAEYFIEESSVRVELAIGGPDLQAFRNLMPDPVYEKLGHQEEPLAKRLGRFFRTDLTIRADQGPPLPGRLRELTVRPRIRRDEITGEPLPVQEEDAEKVVFVVLEYAFSGRPSTLTFTAPGGKGDGPAGNVGFVVYHLDLPVTDFRYLAAEQVLDLDWRDPWYSRFRNRNLRRQYDAPMNAFLYVEPYEVRAEIIVRPLDLQSWVDLDLKDRRTIPVEMQGSLKGKVAEFLAEHCNLTVDGRPVEPVLDRIHFLRRTLRNSTVIEPPEELDAVSATLGVIFVVPRTGLPEEATLTWDLFSPKIQTVPAAATDEAGPLRYFLRPDDNILRWQNFLQNPTVPTLVEIDPPPALFTRGLAAAGWLLGAAFIVVAFRSTRRAIGGRGLSRPEIALPAVLLIATGASGYGAWSAEVHEEEAGEIVGTLLHNIYRSFDFRDEGTVYDMLERSVTGGLLTQTYLETRRALELQSQGGARAKVTDVEVVTSETTALAGEIGFTSKCTWNVAGSVGHWGHIHQRRNQYEAVLTVRPVDGSWKITALELLSEARL